MGSLFHPYVGERYSKDPIFGARLLLIGESHYNDSDESCGPDATREVIARYLAGQKTEFLDYLTDVAPGNKRTVVPHEFWSSVAFANFVQRPMETVKHRPNQDDIDLGMSAFWGTVESLRPDIVFMFTSAWKALPSIAPGGITEGTGGVGGPLSWLWRYAFPDRNILIARFNHPSARHNPAQVIWKAWADHCWDELEKSRV